ncbi:MAG: MFS transporter [Verrucomicrobia bacterium]|nr:MFS transporter [Verrucomicrobiota bacterium]
MKTLLTKVQPRWQVVIFLMVGSALNYGDRAAISSVLPALQTDLRLTDEQLGLVGSLFLWSYALVSPVAGSLADRCSRRRIALVSLLLWSLVTALTGLADGLVSLLVLRVALGVSESFYLPAAIALTASHHGTGTRGKAISLLLTGMNLGVVLGGFGAGFMADHFGWRAGFWMLGLGGIGFGLLCQPLLVDAPVCAGAPEPAKPRLSEVLHYLVRTPSYHILLAKAALSGVAVWIFLSWLPLYFKETFDLSLGMAGLMGAVMLQFTGVLGTMAGGWVSDQAAVRDTRRRMLMHGHGYLLAAPFLLAFLFHPGLALTVAMVACFSFFRGVGNANEQPIVCDIVPAAYRSTAVGLMNTGATAVGGTAVWIAGLLKGTIGLGAVFGLLSVVFVLAAASLLAGYFWCAKRDVARAARVQAGDEAA